MKTSVTCAIFSLLLSFSPSLALAEGKQSSRMSQLDFDQPIPELVSKKPAAAEKIREILSDTKPVASTQMAKSSSSDTTARASLATPKVETPAPAPSKFDWVKPSEGQSHILIPRLKGPFVDAKSRSSITTVASWKKQGGGCADVSDKPSLCEKSKALRELMNRFSGTNEFNDSQCTQSCPNAGERAVLVGFAVSNFDKGSFKIAEDKKSCRYQITTEAQPTKWQMLEGERGTCQCLPVSCL